jgi:hypothetical protein
MHVTVALLLSLSAPLLAQQAPPRFMYIYRDSLKYGVDSAYGAIEDEAAQICADLECPNPYLGLESLSGPHEAWWLNTFADERDTTRVVKAYAQAPLMQALGGIAKRKEPLVGTPIQGFAVYRAELSRGRLWSVAGVRFVLVNLTRNRQISDGLVWEMADSTLYIFRWASNRRQAEALAREPGTKILAVRPNWSMPAPEWVAADPAFWRLAPAPRSNR